MSGRLIGVAAVKLGKMLAFCGFALQVCAGESMITQLFR
jgi:hypothetical protein